MALTLGELAQQVGGEVVGDASVVIRAVATLQNAGPSSISFLANPGYRKYLATTRAGAVIVQRQDVEACPVNALVVDAPYLTYARIAGILNPVSPFAPGIHATAVVASSAQVAESAWIGPHCVVEEDVVVGPNTFVGPGCWLGKGVTLGAGGELVGKVTVCAGCAIGDRAIIHPGVVIGSDGFGIANDGGRWIKVPQLGSVRIGDDVEIGSNTTIDRGALEDTLIADGVKLDNQIQVAHNVRIGAHTAIAGCVGIAGSATIGAHCAIGGGVGIVGHSHIADHVQVTGMSFVSKSIDVPGVYSSGTPLERNDLWRKNFVRFRQLDEIARRLRALEKKSKQD